jgi:hypothetical protein
MRRLAQHHPRLPTNITNCLHTQDSVRYTSPGLSHRFAPADVRIWGLLELVAKLGSTFHPAAIAALIAVLVGFYAPSRLLLTVGVRLASEQGVCGSTPVCIFSLPGRPLFYGV